MTEECLCKTEKVILFPCSGGSNCGLITHEVAVSLDVSGIGCLCSVAGVGAHINGMIKSARSAKRIVAIDGCPVACARKAVEHLGLKVTDWICITEEGINKNHRLLLEQEEIELVTERVKERLASSN